MKLYELYATGLKRKGKALSSSLRKFWNGSLILNIPDEYYYLNITYCIIINLTNTRCPKNDRFIWKFILFNFYYSYIKFILLLKHYSNSQNLLFSKVHCRKLCTCIACHFLKIHFLNGPVVVFGTAGIIWQFFQFLFLNFFFLLLENCSVFSVHYLIFSINHITNKHTFSNYEIEFVVHCPSLMYCSNKRVITNNLSSILQTQRPKVNKMMMKKNRLLTRCLHSPGHFFIFGFKVTRFRKWMLPKKCLEILFSQNIRYL